MTWGFLYLLVFLGGFTLALVTGLVRRFVHPRELCQDVEAPSHEQWRNLHTPITDFVIVFVTVFGLVTLLVHGLSSLSPAREIGIGAAAAVLGAVTLRAWMRHARAPSIRVTGAADTATVVREIPGSGFGTIEVEVGNSRLTLAAKSDTGIPIPAGATVTILDRSESVVVVVPC